MMNLGVVLPEPGYLEAVREITQRHGIVLIFDEVKTGSDIAAGGATERCGVKPDMVTLAKALGGGLPTGAIGGTEEVIDGRRGRQRLPGRHLQRQPARHGGRAREPARGDDARRLRAPRPPQRPHPRRLPGRHRALRPPGLRVGIGSQGLRDVLDRRRSSTTRRSRPTRTPSSPSSPGCST